MEKENIYFVAIIPPQQICDEITAFKMDFSEHFESKAALKVIPHITLKAPFKLSPSAHLELKEWFQKIMFASGPFEVELKNFGCFNNKKHPVVYVHPVLNASLLALQTEIIRSFRSSYPQLNVMETELSFKPHITIAYRDLSFNRFVEAWKIYQSREYRSVFNVINFHLLQHNGKEWDVTDTYHIKQAP